MDKITIIVADDMDSSREFFKLRLNKSSICQCVGTASNEAETIDVTRNLKPDILLLDIQMEHYDSGIRIIPEVLKASPGTKIIILTVHEDNHLIFDAIRLGAKDYIIKDKNWDDILMSIVKVSSNENSLRFEIAQNLLQEMQIIHNKQSSLLYLFSKFSSLTSTEINILQLLCQGKTVKEISEIRFVEQATIRSCISRILKKLEFKNTKQLVKNINELNLFGLLKNTPPKSE